MIAAWTPLLWPGVWKSAAALELLKGTPINCLLGISDELTEPAFQAGMKVVRKGEVLPGVTVIEGIWPGIRATGFGSSKAFSAGPTGEPWVNSNICPIRLSQARKEGTSVWLRAIPADDRYTIAIADAAITGGRWIIALSPALALGIIEGNAKALAGWKNIASVSGYFAGRRPWTDYEPQAVLGVVSDFSKSQSHELLNLIARSGQQYRIICSEKIPSASLGGLRAVIYPDAVAPSTPVRTALSSFVRDGGLLIAAKEWELPPSAIPSDRTHPRFALFSVGKGSLALATADRNDPYLLASDAAILVSHRYDLLRFWNGGAFSAYYSATPDRRRALVQILFYADRPSMDATVRIAGNYRTASISTFETPDPQAVPFQRQPEAIEVHLPPVTRYAAIELE